MSKDSKICVGMIAGAQGIKGQVRLRSFTEDPEAIFTYKPLLDEKDQVFKIKRDGVSKECFITQIDGVKDRNQAEALRGTKLFFDRAKLPKAKKGQFYEADLIGLTAKDGQGTAYGKILTTHNYGAGTFIEIGKDKKDSFMLPFTNACVPEVDIAAGCVTIVVPEGWLNKASEDDEVEE